MLQDKIKSGQDGDNVKKQADLLVEQKNSAKALSVDKMVLTPVVSLQGLGVFAGKIGIYAVIISAVSKVFYNYYTN